jgi:hypothetical protein
VVIASAFAPPARRTTSAALAAEITKRFRLFNMICSMIEDPPLSVQWEIGILGFDFITGASASYLLIRAPTSQGHLSVLSASIITATVQLSIDRTALAVG